MEAKIRERLALLEGVSRQMVLEFNDKIRVQYVGINELRQLLGMPLVRIGPNGEPVEVKPEDEAPKDVPPTA